MLTADLIAEWRGQVGDESTPYLWSDTEAFNYLVEAQDTFVRKTKGIPDFTTRAITYLPVTTDVPFTKFSPYILRVMSAQLETAETPVTIANHSDLPNILTDDYGRLRSGLFLDDDTGTVTHGVLGLEPHKIRWYKVPSSDDTCRLHVYRLPYPRMVDETSQLEIDEQHHRGLLLWMKYLAYSKEDAETFDKNLRDDNEARFLKYCDEARMEIERLRFRPRQVRYGGI